MSLLSSFFGTRRSSDCTWILMYYTVSQKTTLLWLAITSTSTDFDNFWPECCQESKKSNRGYFIFPPRLTSASALGLPGRTRKQENRIFSLKCCITAFPEFSQFRNKVESFVQQLLNCVARTMHWYMHELCCWKANNIVVDNVFDNS